MLQSESKEQDDSLSDVEDDSEIVELQFADPDPDELAAAEQEDSERRFYVTAMWTHASILAVSSIVVFLAISMRVPGEERVFLPGMSTPVPGMCASREFFGVSCPGCGMTRSFICIGHGQFERAWAFNPAGFLSFLFVAAQIPWRTMQLVRLKRGKGEFWPGKFNWVLWVIGGFMLLQWIVRTVT